MSVTKYLLKVQWKHDTFNEKQFQLCLLNTYRELRVMTNHWKVKKRTKNPIKRFIQLALNDSDQILKEHWIIFFPKKQTIKKKRKVLAFLFLSFKTPNLQTPISFFFQDLSKVSINSQPFFLIIFSTIMSKSVH